MARPGPAQDDPPAGLAGDQPWWDGPACETKTDFAEFSRGAVLAGLTDAIIEVPLYAPICVELVRPDLIEECERALDAIMWELVEADENVEEERSYTSNNQLFAESMMLLARQRNLGRGAPAFPELADPLGAMELLAKVARREALRNVTAATGHITAAIRLADPFRPVLDGLARRLAVLDTIAFRYSHDVSELHRCYIRLTSYTAAKLVLGFGVWLPPPGPGPLGSGTGVRVVGLLAAQHPEHFQDYPIEIDFDSYDPSLAEGTRREAPHGAVSRVVLAGYHTPDDLTLEEDVVYRHPSGSTELVAAAGTPIEWAGALDEDGDRRYADIRLENGKLMVLDGRFTLVSVRTDADGRPIGNWLVCETGAPVERTCELGVDSTGSPEEVARGDVKTAYYTIAAGVPRFDNATEEAVGDFTGFRLTLTKRAERPRDPCWEWDYSQRHYVWTCGPVTDPPGGGS